MTEESASARKPPVEFWFDFSSPYGYFAAHEIDCRLARIGRTVEWRPLLLGAVFRLTGMAALNTMPMRGDYARRDWDRVAQMLDVPFHLPEHHPYASQSVARAFYWLSDHHPEAAKPFARAAFQAHFVRQEAPESIDSVIALSEKFVADTSVLKDWLGSDAAKQKLRAMTDLAVGRGVFGSPFFIADGEPFWGWDRIPMLETWLERGGWSAS